MDHDIASIEASYRRTDREYSLFLLVLASLIILLSPYGHNPDGNYYFGIALRLSEGRFSESIDGLYAPLLSWLMAFPIRLGMQVPDAYRLVNFFALGVILLATSRIARAVNFPTLTRRVLVTLVWFHLVYFTCVIVNADLLAAAAFLPAVALLMEPQTFHSKKALILAGAYGALAYYAKAPELILFLLAAFAAAAYYVATKVLSFPSACKSFLIIGLTCAALSSPWIWMISQKYQSFVISGQQLVGSSQLSLFDYSPDDPQHRPAPRIGEPAANEGDRPSLSPPVFKTKSESILYAISYLSATTNELLFGTNGWIFYLGAMLFGLIWSILNFRDPSRISLLSIICVIHISAYLYTWGPYLRYYFPIVPLLHIIFFYGLISVNSMLSKAASDHFSMKSAYKVILWGLCGLLLSSIFLRTILAVKSDWATRMKNPLQTALSLPELKNSHGIITGNAESPYPGLIAYFLKREFWNSIRDENSEELVERLKRWHVSQVIWVGKPSTELEKISWLRKLGPYGEAENAFYIYNVIGSEPENSAK